MYLNLFDWEHHVKISALKLSHKKYYFDKKVQYLQNKKHVNNYYLTKKQLTSGVYWLKKLYSFKTIYKNEFNQKFLL